MVHKKTWVGWLYQALYTSNSCMSGYPDCQIGTISAPQLAVGSAGIITILACHYWWLGNSSDGIILSPTIPVDCITGRGQHPTVPAIWMGDLNMIINPSLDKLSPTNPGSTQLTITRFGRFFSGFTLVDTWRFKYQTYVAFSCFTPSHSAMSHIDLLLALLYCLVYSQGLELEHTQTTPHIGLLYACLHLLRSAYGS